MPGLSPGSSPATKFQPEGGWTFAGGAKKARYADWKKLLSPATIDIARGRAIGTNAGHLRGCLELTNPRFHLLARLEGNHVLRGDIDPITGARVAGLTRLAQLYLKHAKVAQFNSPLGQQRIDNRIERLLHDLLCFELGQAKAIGDLLDDFFLGHDPYSPLKRPGKPKTDCLSVKLAW